MSAITGYMLGGGIGACIGKAADWYNNHDDDDNNGGSYYRRIKTRKPKYKNEHYMSKILVDELFKKYSYTYRIEPCYPDDDSYLCYKMTAFDNGKHVKTIIYPDNYQESKDGCYDVLLSKLFFGNLQKLSRIPRIYCRDELIGLLFHNENPDNFGDKKKSSEKSLEKKIISLEQKIASFEKELSKLNVLLKGKTI